VSVALDTTVRIRRALPSDRAFLAALAHTAFSDFDPRAREHTLASVTAAGAVTLVALRGDQPVGFGVLEFRRGDAALQAIAVEARERGRGVGGRLMHAVEHAARKQGAAALRLCTAQANVEALALFIKHGFRIERRMPRFYPNGQDACMLGKSVLVDGA
jgi:ribosomal protein S18 acetylase RimI-like enzyme